MIGLVRRHEVLRTSLALDATGELMQRVCDMEEIMPSLVCEERHLDSQEQVEQTLHDIELQPFDLAAGLKIRAYLLRYSEEKVQQSVMCLGCIT